MNVYQVSFCERGYWSKPYSYLSKSLFKDGDIVVVPTGSFYSVGKITGIGDFSKLKEGITYKEIIQKLDL